MNNKKTSCNNLKTTTNTLAISKDDIALINEQGYSLDDFLNASRNCNNPYSEIDDNEISNLVYNYIYNKRLIDKEMGLGSFLKYKENRVVGCSDYLYNLVSEKDDSCVFYSFEYLKDHNYDNKHYNFFGSSILFIDLGKRRRSYIFKFLNDYVKEMMRFRNNKDVLALYKYRNKSCHNKLNYEEFSANLIRYKCFSFASSFFDWYENYEDIIKRSSIITPDKIKNKINVLLTRYSYGSHFLFKKVDRLLDYKGKPGIYVLVLMDFRYIYVGQTTNCLYKRILSHINHPSSAFDKSILPSDISDIYVLVTPKDNVLIDDIEKDCVATIGMETLINASVGGHNIIASINDDDYDPEKYLLSAQKLKKCLGRLERLLS